MTNEKNREEALRLSDELEVASMQAIGLKKENLTDEQLDLYRKRRALEIEAWTGVIIENNLRIRADAIKSQWNTGTPKRDGLYFVELDGPAPRPWYESAWWDSRKKKWDLPEASKGCKVIAYMNIPERQTK